MIKMPKVYAFKNTVEEIMKSSSGGAFIAICQAFEKLYGKGNVAFCGATFDENMIVKHMCVDSAEECHIFQGSKYVKSDCNYIFAKLKEKLQSGKKVLFSGTPCQIFAFNAFVKKENLNSDDVLTVDIICHGAPKKEFWLDYKKWIEAKAGASLTGYSFRYKPEGWKAYPAYAEFSNGKKFINTPDTSVYSKMHMTRYSIGKGCFSCPFAKEERISDITLGDYWGVERVMPEMANKKGVSLVLVHTDAGIKAIGAIDNSNTSICETKDRSYLNYQHNLNKPTEMPDRYDEFWKDYKENDFESILKKYIGYGSKYRITYRVKKFVRKTPLIEWYRNRKLNG